MNPFNCTAIPVWEHQEAYNAYLYKYLALALAHPGFERWRQIGATTGDLYAWVQSEFPLRDNPDLYAQFPCARSLLSPVSGVVTTLRDEVLS